MNGLALRRLARLGILGLPGIGLACADTSEYQRRPFTSNYAAIAPSSSPIPAPAADDSFRVRGASEPIVSQPHTLPLDLPSILQMAEERNPHIEIARSKVCAAFSEKELADAIWLPNMYVGLGYWRHSGGIQLQEGPLISSNTQALGVGPQISATYNPREVVFRELTAARKIWQQQGDLTKITTEQLLDATTTYVDLLAAHSALAISQDLEKRLKPWHEKIKAQTAMINRLDLKTEEKRLEAELSVQHQTQQKLQSQIAAASAKLAYLLGVDPHTQIVPVDQMATFHIVDANAPLDQLVAQAQANGPGINEMEGILCVIQKGLDLARGNGRFVPTFELQMGEGLFGAGPGGTMSWDNRWDLGLQARWSINDLLHADRKREVGFSQLNQAHLTYQELQAKLALGVHESRATILASDEQLKTAEGIIMTAKQVVENSEKFIESANTVELKVSAYGAVLMSNRGVATAQLNYLDIMREFDKAQLRLMILLGPGTRPDAKPVAKPAQLPNPAIPRQ